MRLKVTIRQPNSGTPERHVQITADATATAGDVAHALISTGEVAATPATHDATFRVLPRPGMPGRTLPTGVTLLESGLRSGSVVDLVGASALAYNSSPGAPVAVLRVVEGPDEGREFPLPEGDSRIGRGRGSDVLLSDPMVSGDHARIRIRGKVEIIDNRSANGVIVGGVLVTRVELKSGDHATLGASVVEVDMLRAPAGAASSTSTDIMFNRSPLVLHRPSARKVELPAPPADANSPKFPWLAMAAPLVMGSVMFVLSRNAMSLIFVALSPILMIGNWFDQKYRTKKQHKTAIATFQGDLKFSREDLRRKRDFDRLSLEAMYPTARECLRAAAQLSPMLWSRRPENPEFLHVRLGTGDIPSPTTADAPRPGGLPELTDAARAVALESSILTKAPIAVDLRSIGGVGLCGPRGVVDDLARAIVVQVATLHSPAEVVLACLTSTPGRARWSWLDWMPHTSSPHSPIAGNHLSADPGTGKLLLAMLEELVDVRRSSVKSETYRGPIEGEDHLDAPVLPSVVVVADEPPVERARLVRIAERGPDVGVYILWVSPLVGELPAACRAFVDLTGPQASVGLVRHGLLLDEVETEQVDAEAAMALARQLAPVVDGGAPVDDESDLPRSMSVVSLLGVDMCDNANAVLSHWRMNRSLVNRAGPTTPLEGPSSLRAVVGHAGSEEFVLDLRVHGPHALVGGTTGAGKSEFLQSWVLGMANAYSPDRVTFLFVDYKGGAAFAKCVELPHFVGLVTDLNTHLVRRALRSLRAELRYREHLLNTKGAKDLLELEKSGDPDCPPSLIIVVDEFAALVGEVPEFVDGVVDVAQRGRSLGLHLILATQRPAGVIKDNLRANTNLRVALRMADEHDSTDVLGVPIAAHFDPSIPGRGAAKTGPGRITQFQSGFPGARTPATPSAPPVLVSELAFGVGANWKMPERPSVSDKIPKDIERIVDTVALAARLGSVPVPRRPWLDPIEAKYDLAALGQRTDSEIVLGVMDDPDNQRHMVRHFYPDHDGNLLYVGSSGSGKSTALRSLAIASSITPKGGPVHVYGLDFAGGGLSALEPLPSVGAIISGDDEERVGRLLRMLSIEAERRAEAYAAMRASNICEYRQLSGKADEPRILLLIDGFATFRDEYETTSARAAIYTLLVRLLGDGRALGIHVAVTSDRPGGLPSSVQAAFPRKIALRQASEENYLSMGVPRDVLTPQSPPGRCMEVDEPQEMQLAILGNDINVASQAKRIEELAEVIRARGQHHPKRVASLAALIPASGMPNRLGDLAVLGVRDLDLQPMGFDARGIVIIAGLAQSGRTNAVHWLAESVRRRFPDTPLVHLSARRSPLTGLGLWQSSAVGGDDSAELVEILKELAASPSADDSLVMGIFVEYLPEFVGTKVESALTEVIKLCRRNGHLLVADGETTSWSSSWQMLTEARNARTGLLLQPDAVDGDSVLRTSLPRCKRSDFPPGRGFWVSAGKATKVQLPLVD